MNEATAFRRAGDLRDSEIDGAELRARLAKTWGTASGLMGALSTVDHKIIGRRYIVTAFLFLFLAGLAAVAMRVQLAQPEARFIGPDLYNQLFTMHGTTMMFLFAVPVMEAFAVYLVPLMVGTRNIAFPRLNAFSYWVYLFGGLMIWVAFALNIGADTGWFSYVPLAGPEHSPGKRVDFWAQMITFTEVAALAVAVEIIVTVLKQRAPGMTLDRIPIFVWTQLVTSFVVIFAMPAVMIASTMLILDRLVGTHFFNPAEGGDALLWQHLFWFFGHPEVYIIFLPATGFVSSIVVTFSRRPIFGYLAMVLAAISIGFLSFGLWVHHMFTAGVPQLGASFFTAASMLIAIPNGIQIFCWIATLWGGKPVFKTPLLFSLGFIVIFVIGGLTGVMVASVPIDTQVHDTYFVVAHFHYVLIGGAVFPLIGAVYYWFPKLTGRMMSERLGQWNFWLAFVSFNVAFFPMHILGLQGMPRRVYTYQPEMGWGDLNLVVSIGAAFFFLSFVVFLWNVLSSLRGGAPAGDNPWDAGTLEWATSSPPPPQNFDRIPFVASREPLWAERVTLPVVTGLAVDHRELVVSTVTEARPDLRESSPDPSIWPLLAALAVGATFIGSIFTPWAVVWGTPPIALALIGWFWPKGNKEDEG
jgi:cytochrome c oxidase subunit I+III